MQQNKLPIVGSSCFIRTTWMLSATRPLDLPNFGASIRLMSMQEAEELAGLIRRRNVFARHSWENNFYVQRTLDLREITIITKSAREPNGIKLATMLLLSISYAPLMAIESLCVRSAQC